MTITVICPQGHKLTAGEKLAGKSVKCPKCSSLVQIPAAATPAPLKRSPSKPAPSKSTSKPAVASPEPVLDPLSSDNDPFGLGDPLAPLDSPSGMLDESTDPLFGSDPNGGLMSMEELSQFGLDATAGVQPLQQPAYSPQPAAHGPQPAAVRKSTPSAMGPILKSPWIMAGAGSGAFVGLILASLVGWLLLSRTGETSAVAVAANIPVAPSPALVSSAPGPVAPSNVPPPAAANVPPRNDAPAPPPRQPYDLVPYNVDPRMAGFTLPAMTWAAAYDEKSGRLAVTHDQVGVLIYDLDDVFTGELSPVASFKTPGLPTAICCKPLPNGAAFVFAGADEPQLQVVDAETLNALGTVTLSQKRCVDSLSASSSPDDPFVYYTAAQSSRVDVDDCFGRIDVSSMTSTEPLVGVQELRVSPLSVSADGKRVYRTAQGLTVGTWSDAAPSWSNSKIQGMVGGSFVPHPSEEVIASHGLILTPETFRVIAELDFHPKAFFRNRPLVFGISETGLVFASANDYRQLASIPLPREFIRPTKERQGNRKRWDFRQHLSIQNQLATAFAGFAGDNVRNLGLMILSNQFIVVPCEKLGLVDDPSLVVRTPLPQKIAVGKPFTVDLDLDVPNVTFEVVTSDEHPLNAGTPRLLGASATPKRALSEVELEIQRLSQLELAADVDAQQNIVFVTSLLPILGRTLPFKIRIDQETVTVVSVDDLRKELRIERTAGKHHSVTVPVVLADVTEARASNLPTITGRTLSWTPSAELFGPQVLRLRAKAGKVTHDWIWQVEITQAAAELPFFVVGIEPEPNGTRAVVWGQDTPPDPESLGGSSPRSPANKFFVGIYDRPTQQITTKAEIVKPIMAAILHESAIYAALDSRDPTKPTTDGPTQIVKFNAETLKVQDQVAIPVHVSRLEVIANRYLAGYGSRGTTVGLQLSNLKPVDPPVPAGYVFPLAGRLKDGWVWDGVVWDDKMSKPQLLLYPVHFQKPPLNDKQDLTFNVGLLSMRTRGPYVGTLTNGRYPEGYQLVNHPGALDCERGELQYRSTDDASKQTVRTIERFDYSPATASVRLVPRPVRGQYENTEKRIIGYVSEDAGEVYVALLGRLFTVPLSQLLGESKPFRFVERQETFVLQPGKFNVLKYSAPGAAKYELRMWRERPIYDGDEPFLVLESVDGEFALDASALDSYVSDGRGVQVAPETMQQMTKAFERLVGRKPLSVPSAVFVMVIAYHEDGQQRAGLGHFYLVENPARKR